MTIILLYHRDTLDSPYKYLDLWSYDQGKENWESEATLECLHTNRNAIAALSMKIASGFTKMTRRPGWTGVAEFEVEIKRL